jgi:hypothetical protein
MCSGVEFALFQSNPTAYLWRFGPIGPPWNHLPEWDITSVYVLQAQFQNRCISRPEFLRDAPYRYILALR